MSSKGSEPAIGVAGSEAGATRSPTRSSTFERPGVAGELKRLQHENEELSGLVEAKDRLIADIAHELRAPLNTIVGWSEMLLGERCLEPMVEKGLRVIQRNAAQQARLVDDLMEGARLAHRKVELNLAPVALDDVLRVAVENARHQAHQRRVEVRVDDMADVQFIVVDADRLQQVLSNLVSNAIKFSPPDSSVDLTVRSDDRMVEIAVQDSGPSLDPAEMPRLLERYEQGPSGVRTGQGLGIGLAIAKEIVTLHGGELRFEDTARGARFAVVLPKAPG